MQRCDMGIFLPNNGLELAKTLLERREEVLATSASSESAGVPTEAGGSDRDTAHEHLQTPAVWTELVNTCR